MKIDAKARVTCGPFYGQIVDVYAFYSDDDGSRAWFTVDGRSYDIPGGWVEFVDEVTE